MLTKLREISLYQPFPWRIAHAYAVASIHSPLPCFTLAYTYYLSLLHPPPFVVGAQSPRRQQLYPTPRGSPRGLRGARSDAQLAGHSRGRSGQQNAHRHAR